MEYNIELASSQEYYHITNENDKEYRLENQYWENMFSTEITVWDDETDIDITDTQVGQDIIKQFRGLKQIK